MNEKGSSDGDRDLSGKLASITRRRRLAMIMIMTGLLLLLILFNLTNVFFYGHMREQLESEQELRLKSVAVLSVAVVEGFFIDALAATGSELDNPVARLLLEDRLDEIKRTHQLEGVYIIDRDFQTVAENTRDLEVQVSHSYLRGDSTGIARAWTGLPVASPLYEVNGHRFKSAYAPVHDPGTGVVTGLLITEANAYFFDILERYRNTFMITAVISVCVFALLTAFIVYALRLLIRTQESLNRSERLAMMGQMSAVLAHEIRNPLGIIRGTADVLKSRYQDRAGAEPLLQYIPDEVDRLNKLVNNFLILSRETRLSVEKNDLNQLIIEIIEKAKLDLGDRQAVFEFDPGPVPPFDFDADAVGQVLINMIRNAIQSLDTDGKISITTRIARQKNTDMAQIEISDTGAGIEGDAERVFEPFYTTKSSGSGLGMPVSKKIIEDHGGQITVDSTSDTGTTFCIFLPLDGEHSKGDHV